MEIEDSTLLSTLLVGINDAPPSFRGANLETFINMLVDAGISTEALYTDKLQNQMLFIETKGEYTTITAKPFTDNTELGSVDIIVTMSETDYGKCLSVLQDFVATLEGSHAEGRAREYVSETLKGKLLWLRLYKDSEWPCKEHPEYAMNQPVGMYHCPECGQMVMAGSIHLDYSATI